MACEVPDCYLGHFVVIPSSVESPRSQVHQGNAGDEVTCSTDYSTSRHWCYHHEEGDTNSIHITAEVHMRVGDKVSCYVIARFQFVNAILWVALGALVIKETVRPVEPLPLTFANGNSGRWSLCVRPVWLSSQRFPRVIAYTPVWLEIPRSVYKFSSAHACSHVKCRDVGFFLRLNVLIHFSISLPYQS